MEQWNKCCKNNLIDWKKASLPILLKSGDDETSVCQKGLEHLEHKRQEVVTCRRYDKEMKDGYSEIIATISQEM